MVLVVGKWLLNPIIASSQEDAVALALVVRLHDVRFGPLGVKLVLELLVVRG